MDIVWIIYIYIFTLVGGDWNIFFSINLGDVIIPMDELILFRGVGLKPPSSSGEPEPARWRFGVGEPMEKHTWGGYIQRSLA